MLFGVYVPYSDAVCPKNGNDAPFNMDCLKNKRPRQCKRQILFCRMP